METLFDTVNSPELASGVFPSSLAIAVPFWAEGENVIFLPGKVKKLPGWQNLNVGTISGDVGALAQEFTGSETRLYIATDSNWYSWDGTTLTGIGSGFGAKEWSLIPWETWLIGTNNSDVPQVWKNTGTSAALAGVPFAAAKIFKKLGPHLLAYNTSNGANFLEWCSANQPEIWTPAAANSAGNLTLRELDSGVVAVQDLRGGHAVYSQDTMVFVQWISLNDGFGRRKAINGVGAIGKHAVVGVHAINYGISRRGVWVTDGVTVEYIDYNSRGNAVAKLIQDELDFALGEEVIGWHDEENFMVRWEYPTTSGTRRGIGFSYKTGGWSVLPATGFDFAIEQQVFNFPLAAKNRRVFNVNDGKDADGTAMECWVRTKPMGLGDDEKTKIVQALRVYVDDFTDFKVRFGTQEEHDDAPTYHTDYAGVATIDLNQNQQQENRFAVVEFRSTSLDADWELNGFKLLGQKDVAYSK